MTLPTLALLFFISENPFEFTDPYCDLPDDRLAVWDVVTSGCLDARYVVGFIGIYALTIFIPSLIVFGLMRIYSSTKS
jgi:hypothetical protein